MIATSDQGLPPDPLSPHERELVVAHYTLAAGLLVPTFGAIPIVAGYTRELGSGKAIFESALSHPVPASIPTIAVTTTQQSARYIALAENSLVWLAHRGAIEFMSWAPVADDPEHLAFGRILLQPAGTASHAMVKDAAFVLKGILEQSGIRCVPVLGGLGGISLWIPFDDRPTYPAVRAWLHRIGNEAERRHPSLICVEAPLSERGNRVHVAVSSNAPGRFSALPYCLRAFEGLPMLAPVTWAELPALRDGDITASTFADRLNQVGDVFASAARRIGEQHAADVMADDPRVFPATFVPLDVEPRGHILQAAIAILADGKPRSADDLCDEAIQRDLVPHTTSRKYFYTALTEYIARCKAHDRKPMIVQDPDRRFRSNHPADDWPAPKHPLAKRAPAPNAAAVTANLRQTASGDDPAAFEIAVCNAFEALGFRAAHIGGMKAPDGYIDAPLGALGYRAMIECKTARGVVTQPNAVEAAEYREAYGAHYAALIGPAFGEWVALGSELVTHRVSAFTVDDLAALLDAGSNPHEMKPLFAGGFAAEKLADLLWQREHGTVKRVAVVCEILQSLGWKEQYAAAAANRPDDSPALTEDAAMMLVDQFLFNEHDAQQPCERARVKAAFAYLTSPLVDRATWLDDAPTAIVITVLGPSTDEPSA